MLQNKEKGLVSMNIKKPLIGVVPLVDEEKESYWMLPGYMKGVELAGGLPVMLPLTLDHAVIEQIAKTMDAFLFTGGQDVSPDLYGECRLLECGSACVLRDKMEHMLLTEVIAQNKPILGICRGIQFLNAVFGGTLYQDLPTQHASGINHHQLPPYDIPVHKVIIKEGTPLHQLLQTKELQVNSYHHQAIRKLSAKLKVMAVSEDGLIEAVYMPGRRFVWAVQWHPEFSFEKEEASRKIFGTFVKEAY